MTKYDEYLARKRAEHGTQFDPSDLAPQFVRYYNSGERVRVQDKYGETRTGTIGVTTGWKPAFLLMATSRSLGSTELLSTDDQVVAVKHGRTYVATR
jgi:hypothetical protein